MEWMLIDEDCGVAFVAPTKRAVVEHADPFEEGATHRSSAGWYEISRWWIVRGDVARRELPEFFGPDGAPLTRAYPDEPLRPYTGPDED